jgi:hypothetical protein
MQQSHESDTPVCSMDDISDYDDKNGKNDKYINIVNPA